MWSLPTLGLNLPIYKMSTQTEMRFLLLLSQAEQIDWQLQNPPHQRTPNAPQTSRMALSGQHLSCSLVTVTKGWGMEPSHSAATPPQSLRLGLLDQLMRLSVGFILPP